MPGDADSAARHINNRGEVFGTSGKHAFLWTADTGMIDLGTLDEISSSNQPTAINDRGQVVGVSINALSQARGFLWTADTGMIDLGILGQIGPTSFSGARAINDRGHVVGRSFIAPPGGPVHTFLWTADTGMIDLGTLGGSTSVTAINDRGDAVGTSATASGDLHAFVWTAETGMIDLGTLGADGSSHAGGSNELGQVVGASSF